MNFNFTHQKTEVAQVTFKVELKNEIGMLKLFKNIYNFMQAHYDVPTNVMFIVYRNTLNKLTEFREAQFEKRRNTLIDISALTAL